MKPRKLVAGMAAAGGGLMLLTTVLFKDEIHDWLFAIRRVRTWGDLLAQTPIRLSDGVVVRLGIEDTRCPQGSGVLLYCLTEGYDPSSPRIGSHHTDDGLGPLEVSVVEEGAVLEEQKSEVAHSVSLWKKTTARLLFARSIPVPRSGRYHVTVSEGGKALRHVTVKYDNLWRMPFPYVMTLHQAPTDGADHRGFHFHAEFHPPLRKPDLLKYLAGPEIGGGNFLSDTVGDSWNAQRAHTAIRFRNIHSSHRRWKVAP